ncbi:MAG TPA: WD40 repeat domain-containing protein, partial [Pirellulaceae bacterium]|nr:WD40 repeat domain-containing protein [Pirellulaceae bacterium]
NATSLLLNPGQHEAVVVFVNSPPGKDREVRIVSCDLKAGKVNSDVPWMTSFTPVDLSPSGELLACMPDQFTRNASEKNKIAIMRREGQQLTPVIRWSMGEGLEFAKKFEQVHFLGEDRLLAFSAIGGSVTLFQIDQAKALWSVKTAQHNTPTLSANRAQFAAVIDGGIGIFNAATGDTLARISTETPLQRGTLSFSPDGKRLAHLTSAVLLVWDLTTGKQIHEVWFPTIQSGKSLDWCGEGFVLVDRSQLVDLDKRIVLWEYEFTGRGQPLAGYLGGRFWLVASGSDHVHQLFSPTIPDASAVAKSQQLTADGVLALKPGAQVSVQVNLPAHGGELQKVTQELTNSLTKLGFIVVAGAPLTLEATITDDGKESVDYRGFGFGRRGSDKVEVQKYTSNVTLKENGKVIWTAGAHYGAPHMVRQKDGQTIQQAVDEQRGNPVDFFAHVRIPRQMARHEADGAYGRSKLAP